MILVRRPSADRVEEYRRARVDAAPTASAASSPPPGFANETFERTIGSGPEDLRRARGGLAAWAAHRGSGVEISPRGATLTEGETVAILTRQLGLWVLAACRIETVIDEPTRFGFVYSTLPDHPECGYESFIVSGVGGDITFTIEAVSRPGILLVRLGAPLTRVLQRRAIDDYLSALATHVRDGSERR